MSPLKRKYLLRSFLFSGLALVVMQLLVLDPFEREADFQLSDFFERAFERHVQKRISDDIVIVKVDKEGRDGIVRTARLVSEAGASVTTLDILMDHEEEGDIHRASVLEGCGSNLVLPTTFLGRPHSSVYNSVSSALNGHIELTTPADKGETIRYYRSITDGSTSLAGIAAYTYRNGDVLLDGKDRLIDFSTAYFDELTPEEVADDPSCVAGRIALICNVNDFGDVHLTPLGPMSGALIQAHITDTILHERAPHACPSWIPLLIAFFLCAFLFWPTLMLSFEKEKNDLAFFILRIVQLLLLLLIYCLGAILYVRYHFYIDLSICLLLIGSASLTAECIIGIRAFRNYMKERKDAKPDHLEGSARKNEKE